MVLPVRRSTPVSDAIKNNTRLHGPVKFGVLDLEIIHHMFCEAAFWRVQAMNSHVVETDAFDHNFGYYVLEGVTFGLGGPGAVQQLNHWATIQSVENGTPSKLAHLTRIFGQQMCEQYWETMHRSGVDAAQAYARNMEVMRTQARDQVMEMYRTTTNHNLALAAQAEIARKTFSTILTVAEVSMVVVSCMISCGCTAAIGPVFLDTGATMAGTVFTGTVVESSVAGWTATAITTGYAVAAEAVKNKSGTWQAIGVKCQGTASKKLQGTGVGVLGVLAKRGAQQQELSRMAGLNALAAKVQKISTRFNVTNKLANVSVGNPTQQALKNSLLRAAVYKKAVPVVFAVPSIVKIIQDGIDRWNED